MSATRTFTPLSGDFGATPPTAFVNNKAFGYQDAESTRQAIDIAGYCGLQHDFGGSEDVCVITGAATWVPVRGAREFTINGDSLGGLTIEAVVFYKTTSGSTAVQTRVRNTTDSSTAATGASSTSTSTVKEALTVTLASGDKVYRLEMLGDATNPVFGWGYWRVRHVPT